MTTLRIGLVTIAHRRHDHLRLQQRSLGCLPADVVRVVVALDDDVVPTLVGDAIVAHVAGDPAGLPLAAARNAGARAAIGAGATRLVFLDVDCLAGPGTISAYAGLPVAPGSVWCGPVTYLRDADRPYALDRLAELDAPHPARPDPGPGRCLVADGAGGWELFWSLSFALDVNTWDRVGGFDEAYVGYGAEDTDFGQRAARAGCRLVWVGDARTYHQWHPTHTPPIQHTHDIVRNANLFHDRWQWWPMRGWLDGLHDLGLVDLDGDRWVVRA